MGLLWPISEAVVIVAQAPLLQQISLRQAAVLSWHMLAVAEVAVVMQASAPMVKSLVAEVSVQGKIFPFA